LRPILQFLPHENSRRILSATIDVFFGDEHGNLNEGPEVERISPHGLTALRPTTRHVESKFGVNASVQGGGGPVAASAGVAWEKTVTREEEAQTTITGISRYEKRTGGGKNAVRWRCMENKTTNTGIPSRLRSLILLTRENSEKYIAVVKIEVEADFKSAFAQMIGKKDKDDPVIFDPNPSAQPRKLKWATANGIVADELESVDLDEHILFT